MRKIKEILRLKWALGLSNQSIGRSIKVSSSTVSDCLRRAKEAGLNWPLLDFSDEELEELLYPAVVYCEHDIDWPYIHQELRRRGVTRELLWQEYKNSQPDGVSYSRFCTLYRHWQKGIDCCMRQTHKAGEKLFVDYAGMTVPIVDGLTGSVATAQIFVATLGASSYTFVEATSSQALPDWLGSHARAFKHFGGVPEIVVPDNLRSGVQKAHRYEPDLNPSYADLADHYGVAVIPARVASPRDKAKVEEAVQHVERQILAKLRNRTFFSIKELNEAIKPLLAELNAKDFQKLPGSRKSQFDTLEQPALRPLPSTPYVFAEWKKAKAGVDYHVLLDGHYYSVPYKLIKKELDIRFTKETVEVFYKSKRVASHRRSYQSGSTTVKEHMPRSHREYADLPQKVIAWAAKNGEATACFTEKLLESKKHPSQAIKSCQGIMSLGKSYGDDRLENACKRALRIKAYSYRSVQSILKNNLDSQIINDCPQAHATEIMHEYVRGRDYFK